MFAGLLASTFFRAIRRRAMSVGRYLFGVHSEDNVPAG